jgi:hypothetical protein
LARPTSLQGVGNNYKINALKNEINKPLTMAQGGGKPSYFVPKRVGK